MSVEAGDVLTDRYELEERLGSGGAAIVWRAHDRLLGRTVAVKLLHPRHERDADSVARFQREARAAAALNHPNAVAIYDIGSEDDETFIVMEYVDGPGLDTVLRGSPLDPEVVAALGHQVSAALGAAHARGLIHRDIKPANVLLSSTGQAKLADFGIAKAIDSEHTTLTQAGTMVGTVAYLAPEQIRHDPVDRRADVYALGLVLYEALVGETPFGRGTPAEVAGRRLAADPPPLTEHRQDLPPGLVAVVTRATRLDPDERFADGTELARALEGLFGAEPDQLVRRLLLGATPRGEDPDRTRLLTSLPADEAETIAIGPPVRPQRDDDTPVFPVIGPEPRSGDTEAPAHAARAAPATDASDTPTGGEEGDESGSRTIPADAWRAVGALVVLVIVLLGGVSLLGGDGSRDGAGDGEPRVIEVADAGDFDPFGDGEEHAEDVPLAHDGDPATAWVTERYDSPDMGGLKPGVGIWFDLGEPSRLTRIELTVSPGISLKVRVAGAPPDGTDEPSWGTHITTIEDADGQLAIDVPAEAGGRYVLVWITSVGGAGERAEVSEVEFVGR